MPRSLPSPMITEVAANQIALCILLDITLVSGTAHVWSGVGTISYGGNSYLGVGSFGAVGEISEGSDVHASGTSVQLSGIDSALLGDTLSDIWIGAPATIWLATFSAGAIVAAYPWFVGTVDAPSFPIGPETFSITLALETRMTNLQRPGMRRYTTGDQMYYFPLDSGFNWVEILNDIALIWG